MLEICASILNTLEFVETQPFDQSIQPSPLIQVDTTVKYTEEKKLSNRLQMSFPIGNPFSIRFFLLADAQRCQLFCLFVCFAALRPKSTAMVIAGRSVHLTTLFPGQA